VEVAELKEPIQFVYFDVSKNEYVALSTQPFKVQVVPAATTDEIHVYSSPKAEQPSGLKKKKVEFTGRDILPLKEELDALENQRLMSLPRFITFLLVPFFLYLAVKIFFIFTTKREDPERIMVERANRFLKNASHPEVSTEEFLSYLYRAVIFAVFSKAGVKGESVTYAEAEEILRYSGHSGETAREAADCWKRSNQPDSAV